MEKGLSKISKEESMRENGKKICKTDKGSSIGKTEHPFMKANSRGAKRTEKEYSSGKMDHTMKATLWMDSLKEMALISSKTKGRRIKERLLQVRLKERER